MVLVIDVNFKLQTIITVTFPIEFFCFADCLDFKKKMF